MANKDQEDQVTEICTHIRSLLAPHDKDVKAGVLVTLAVTWVQNYPERERSRRLKKFVEVVKKTVAAENREPWLWEEVVW
jgi:hypothetical protein